MIAAGLYLVVWGKSKDYEPQDLSIDKENAVKSKQIIEASRINDEENHKVLFISESKEEEKESKINDNSDLC